MSQPTKTGVLEKTSLIDWPRRKDEISEGRVSSLDCQVAEESLLCLYAVPLLVIIGQIEQLCQCELHLMFY